MERMWQLFVGEFNNCLQIKILVQHLICDLFPFIIKKKKRESDLYAYFYL